MPVMLHITLTSMMMNVVVAMTTLAEAVCGVAFCGVTPGGVDSNLFEIDWTANMQGQLHKVKHHVSFDIH